MNVRKSFVTSDGIKLGKWVNYQRHQYAKKQRGEKSHLDDDRLKKLERINFSWEANQAKTSPTAEKSTVTSENKRKKNNEDPEDTEPLGKRNKGALKGTVMEPIYLDSDSDDDDIEDEDEVLVLEPPMFHKESPLESQASRESNVAKGEDRDHKPKAEDKLNDLLTTAIKDEEAPSTENRIKACLEEQEKLKIKVETVESKLRANKERLEVLKSIHYHEQQGHTLEKTYEHLEQGSDNEKLESTMILAKRPIMANSGLLPDESPMFHFERPEESNPKECDHIPMRLLREQYKQEYVHHQEEGKITVSSLSTYQGRIPASVNGCSLIAALVAARHLVSKAGTGIMDSEIAKIIDQESGPILQEIRAKLGLDGSSSISPSDIYDHFADNEILKKEYFLDVIGGNIMDPDRIAFLVHVLSIGKDGNAANRKTAATLYFREHCVSIVKSPFGQNQSYYDLVESLQDRSNGETATRTRCINSDSLEVLLRWYASRKFSDSMCSDLDQTLWDDSLADSSAEVKDPRVFQAYVWGCCELENEDDVSKGFVC